jgi:hypothetical protein
MLRPSRRSVRLRRPEFESGERTRACRAEQSGETSAEPFPQSSGCRPDFGHWATPRTTVSRGRRWLDPARPLGGLREPPRPVWRPRRHSSARAPRRRRLSCSAPLVWRRVGDAGPWPNGRSPQETHPSHEQLPRLSADAASPVRSLKPLQPPSPTPRIRPIRRRTGRVSRRTRAKSASQERSGTPRRARSRKPSGCGIPTDSPAKPAGPPS